MKSDPRRTGRLKNSGSGATIWKKVCIQPSRGIFDMEQKYLLGFDIGGTKCAAILGAIRDGGEPEPLSRTQFATRECATPGECIEKLCRLGLAALRQAGLRPGGLHGVGVSCVNALADWKEDEVYRGGKA